MNGLYSVTWSLEAIYDVADIADYIEARFGRARADRFEEEISNEVGKLSYLSSLYGNTGFQYRGMQIQRKIISPSIVFFSTDKTDGRVYILRVLRHERDWQNLLKEQITFGFEQ